jgi:hypothetical protein
MKNPVGAGHARPGHNQKQLFISMTKISQFMIRKRAGRARPLQVNDHGHAQNNLRRFKNG